jgi:hypothetical protein
MIKYLINLFKPKKLNEEKLNEEKLNELTEEEFLKGL